jgi:hypothetical protein
MLFKKVTTLYSENHTKFLNTKWSVYWFLKKVRHVFIIGRLRVRKVKWSYYTPWRRFRWEEVSHLIFLNLGARKGWVVSITPRPHFTPGVRAPGTHCTGGWVGPGAGLDAEVRGKIFCLCRGPNLGHPVCSQALH